MKRNYIIVLIIVLTCSYFIYELFAENNQRKYVEEILKMRAEKDIYFKSSGDSPVKGNENFVGLSYFNVDPAFRFQGIIDQDSIKGKEIRVKMSDGVNERFIHSGTVRFEKDDQWYSLISFKNMDDRTSNRLFVPFMDSTSGDSSYGAGRYLDLIVEDNKVIIDFNLAYHPYCLYNHQYICPIPPPENFLPFSVTAGEKLP